MGSPNAVVSSRPSSYKLKVEQTGRKDDRTSEKPINAAFKLCINFCSNPKYDLKWQRQLIAAAGHSIRGYGIALDRLLILTDDGNDIWVDS